MVVAAQGGELVGEGQGPLQPDGRAPAVLGERVQRGESLLYPRGLAPKSAKRMGDEIMGKDGRGEQPQKGGSREREGTGGRGQSNGKWSMPGFSVDPGGAVLVAGRHTMEAVQSQVTLQGIAGRETWLGVDLLKGRGRAKVTGWMQSGDLQRRAAGDAGWLARLRGRGREGWSVEDHSWVCSGGPAVAGHGLRVEWTGHRVEEGGQETMEGEGTSNGGAGMEQELGARQGQGGARQGV